MKIINKALFSYFGNKDREIEKIMEKLPDMNNIDIIIEPYCGSFSLIRNLILMYPDKKYICVDNDEKLIQVYNDIIEDDKYNKNFNNLKNHNMSIGKVYMLNEPGVEYEVAVKNRAILKEMLEKENSFSRDEENYLDKINDYEEDLSRFRQ